MEQCECHLYGVACVKLCAVLITLPKNCCNSVVSNCIVLVTAIQVVKCHVWFCFPLWLQSIVCHTLLSAMSHHYIHLL